MRKILVIIPLIFTLAGMATWFLIKDSYAESDIIIIIHKSRPKLTATQIRRIFTGELTTWPNGGKIKVLINRNNIVKPQFFTKYLNMSITDFKNIWINKQIRDGVSLPREGSSEIIKKLIAGSPRYIGFIKRSELDPSVKAAN